MTVNISGMLCLRVAFYATHTPDWKKMESVTPKQLGNPQQTLKSGLAQGSGKDSPVRTSPKPPQTTSCDIPLLNLKALFFMCMMKLSSNAEPKTPIQLELDLRQ
jgi:hypothetical protein